MKIRQSLKRWIAALLVIIMVITTPNLFVFAAEMNSNLKEKTLKTDQFTTEPLLFESTLTIPEKYSSVDEGYVDEETGEIDANFCVKAFGEDLGTDVTSEVPKVQRVEVLDLYQGEILLTWEIDEESEIDGFSVYALTYDENNELEETLIADLTDISLREFAHDVAEFQVGTEIFYQVRPYVIENETKLEASTPALMESGVVRGEALSVDVSWYIKTTVSDDYLMLLLTGENDCDYVIFYSNEDGSGVTKIMDVTKEEAIAGIALPNLYYPYNEEGYFFVTDSDGMCAIQDTPYKVGGAFVEPVLEEIPDIAFGSLEESYTLNAVITNPMDGFRYTYQWYVQDSIVGKGTAIEGATDSSYEVSITSAYELKYYYCVVTCEYRAIMNYSTENGNDMPTQITGNLFGTAIKVSRIENVTFSGTELEPEVIITDGDRTLIRDVDYTVIYKNNVNAGEYAKAIITFINAYEGIRTKMKYFTILPLEAEKLTYPIIEEQTYTGDALEPEFVVLNGTIELVEGEDYTVEYKNNVEMGTASVVLTFTGNYTGTATLYFSIINPIPSKVTSERVTVDDTTGYISKITAGTTVGTFVSTLNERNYISIREEGNVVEESQLIGTGMNVCIMDGNDIKRSYTVVVTGDTNGDGKINITDMIAVKAKILKKSNLSGAFEKAADVNGDGKINITDFIKVKAALLEKDTITGIAVAD